MFAATDPADLRICPAIIFAARSCGSSETVWLTCSANSCAFCQRAILVKSSPAIIYARRPACPYASMPCGGLLHRQRMEAGEEAAGVVFKDCAAVGVGEPGDGFEHGLDVVEGAAGLGV